MLERFAEVIAGRLVCNESIPEDNKSLVSFGIVIGLRSIIQIIILLVTAAIMNRFVLGVILLLAFTPIRVFAGGYHAKTPIQCLIKSWLLFFCILLWAAFMPQNLLLQILVLGVAGVSIWFFAPVEDEHKPLQQYEYKKYKKKALLLWGAELTIFILAYLMKWDVISRGIALGQGMMLFILYLGVLLHAINIQIKTKGM